MEAAAMLYFLRGLRRDRVFNDPLDPLHISDSHLLLYYRFPRPAILDLIKDLEPHLARTTSRSHALPASTQVLAALRFFASGSFQHVIGDTVGISQASVCQAINTVTNVLYEKASTEIRMPANLGEITHSMQKFSSLNGFPRIIGLVDGTLIPIKPPSVAEQIYVSRKKIHSLNVMAVCDADMFIINYCAKFPGSSHDSYVFNNSSLKTRFVNGEFHNALLLGDSGYALDTFLMTPIAAPVTRADKMYNKIHRKTRVVVEQVFGSVKNRFRCLHRSGGALQYTPDKSAKIVVACFLLHNYCIRRGVPAPDMLYELDELADEPNVHDGNVSGINVRNSIVANFFT